MRAYVKCIERVGENDKMQGFSEHIIVFFLS